MEFCKRECILSLSTACSQEQGLFSITMTDKHIPSFGSFGTSLVPRFTYFMSQSNICTSQCTEISTSSQRCESADKYSAKYFISFTKRSRGQVKSCFTTNTIIAICPKYYQPYNESKYLQKWPKIILLLSPITNIEVDNM